MFFGGGQYYYLIIALQVFCAIHSYRRGTLNRWIFLILFLPIIGSLVYIYSEILANRGNVNVIKPVVKAAEVINPGARIKKLEDVLRFSDTFANRVNLADAYLGSGRTMEAIELYKSSLKGAFAENEHVMAQLMTAYFELQRYNEVIPLAKKIYAQPQFVRSRAHIIYALSLEAVGSTAEAEQEFNLMKGRYAYYEARYQYGLFLIRTGRETEARQMFTDMLNEEPQLSPAERRLNRTWFANAKDELRKLPA